MKERRKWGKQNENKKVFVIFLRLSNFQISIIGNDISLFYFHSIIIPSSKRFQNIDSIYIYNLLVISLLWKDYTIMTRFQNYLIFQNANWNTVIDNRLWKRVRDQYAFLFRTKVGYTLAILLFSPFFYPLYTQLNPIIPVTTHLSRRLLSEIKFYSNHHHEREREKDVTHFRNNYLLKQFFFTSINTINWNG